MKKLIINNNFEKNYKEILENVLLNGSKEKNRTGIDCITLFDQNLKIDMSEGLLPIVTGKKIFYDKAYHEFYWIINGLTNIKYLNDNNIFWWDEYANNKGELGKTYGYQLRNYNGNFDQLNYVCNELKYKSRRAHITLWNPSELNETALPCCYTDFTFVVTNEGETLNMNMNFRSSDLFLGLPYDIIIGSLFLKHIADFSELKMGYINYKLNNAHIYENHIDQVKKYLSLEIYDLPIITGIEAIPKYKSGPYIEAKLNN